MSDRPDIKGTLIPIGGGEDKGEHEATRDIYLQRGVLRHVLDESGGPEARIVVVTSASQIPEEVGQNYLDAFALLGCTQVVVHNITSKQMAEDQGVINDFAQATGVMFSGGNQARIPRFMRKTPLHRLLDERYTHERFTIAGTSAGAMAMSRQMISGGSSTEALLKGAVSMRKGMGFIPGLIIDTHFVRRGRFGRLAEAVATYPKKLGIGLAEDTGVIIRGGKEFTVIGSGMVIVMDPANLTHNSHSQLDEGQPMSLVNLTTHVLANGDRFTLDRKTVEVLPMKAEFV